MIRRILILLILVISQYGNAQKECDKKVVDLFQKFSGKELNPVKYCFDGDDCNVNPNVTDSFAYDLVFDLFKGWECTSKIKVTLYYYDTKGIAMVREFKKEEVEYLYLSSFSSCKNNLIIRLIDIPDNSRDYGLYIENDQGKQIYTSGKTVLYFVPFSAFDACDE